MPRLIDVISASVLAIAACDSPAARTSGQAGSAAKDKTVTAPTPAATPPPAPAPPAPAKPTTSLEQVQQGAASGSRVAAAELTVKGIELFAVTEDKPPAEDGSASSMLVGVVGGVGGTIIEGSELMRAVIERKPDPTTLARVALWIAQREGEILAAPANAEQRKAKVRRPVIARNALAFWALTAGPLGALERGKLDLATGLVDLRPASHDKAIATATAALGGTIVSSHTAAIKALALWCAEPRPKAVLLSALGNHTRAETRASVADLAHKCGPAAVQPLVDAMENDKSAVVRVRAASALGRVGDKRARPALAKAAKSEDANLVWAANNALKKLQ